jgi:hypothetical protein
MSDPNRPAGRPETETLPPGADRFWGQFSQAKAGRTHAEEEPAKPEPEASREEGQHCLEWCPICRSADIVRATAPPDAIGQVQAIQNEAVGVLKSFLAIYAERSGQGGGSRGGDSGHGGSGDSGRSGGSSAGSREQRDGPRRGSGAGRGDGQPGRDNDSGFKDITIE